MCMMPGRSLSGGWVIAVLFVLIASSVYAEYPLEVFPREDKAMTDPETGAPLLFLTTGASCDQNLYFHQRSWLADSSMIFFDSDRNPGGLMAYIVATGELVRIAASDGSKTNRPTACFGRNSVFAMADDRVLEIGLRVETAEHPETEPSKVFATERVIATVPGVDTYLNENCDGRYLAAGCSAFPGKPIVLIRVEDGHVEPLCTLPGGVTYHGHVQWSISNPYWLSFAGAPIRIWVVDIRDRKPWAPYRERENELVTHESWWVDDQLIFCGGIHPQPKVDSHVKALDPRTGKVRIVGEGAWLPHADEDEVALSNWWHASGSPDGRWVAADNWGGRIMLFEGLTARPRLLTVGHREFGQKEHPHVGWDRKGRQVIVTSHKIEGVHPCVITIPQTWQEDADQFGKRIETCE